MKKALFFLLCTAATQALHAQVKIGDNPITINPNSLLELESSNKGLLLPRIGLDSTSSFAPLTAHVAGMTVYNTDSSGTGATGVLPGFYYNDGTQWVRLGAGGDAWQLLGNASTNPGTAVLGSPVDGNFLGTTDPQDLILATNGIKRAVLNQQGSLTGGAGTPISASNSIVWGTSNMVGGYSNIAVGNSNTLENGAYTNAAFGSFNTVRSTAYTNIVSGSRNVIGGSAYSNSVFGNDNYLSSGTYTSFIAGQGDSVSNGYGNAVTGDYNTVSGTSNIVGGSSNKLYQTNGSAVFGGRNIDSAGYSIMAGYNNRIGGSGNGAAVFGDGNFVDAPNSIAVGSGNQVPNSNYGAAFGINNFVRDGAAFGTDNNITGQYAAGFGSTNTVSGQQAVAFGRNNSATGELTAAFGQGNLSAGQYSATFGRSNNAGGNIDFLVGEQNVATGYHNYAFGYGNNLSNTGAFAVGQSNVISGQLASAVGFANHATGQLAIAFGVGDTVSGSAAVAFGSQNNVRGELAVAFGYANQVSGIQAAAIGGSNTVSGYQAAALGDNNTVSGDQALSIGANNTSAGRLSATLGLGTIENSYIGLAAGRYNAITTGTSDTGWVATDPLVQVGVGTDNANRANALTMLKNGNVGLSNVAIAPTERLDVGQGNVRIRDINSNTGTATDNFVVADANGVLKTVAASTFDADLRVVGLSNHITVDAGVGANGTDAGSGAANIGIGNSSLGTMATGHNNIAIGQAALYSNDNGIENIAIGMNSLALSTTSFNTGVGSQTLAANTTGFSNTAVGRSALAQSTTGSSNTAVGMYALSNLIIGDNNTTIGYGTGSSLTSGSNNIFIGNAVQPNVSTTGSDQLNIGNWIYGDNGKIGIAEPLPTSTLQVNGTIATSLRIVTADDSFAATDYTILKTGGAAATISLPPASSCPGRMYRLVEFAGDGNASTITISPAVQTYDGFTQYTSTNFWEIHTNLSSSGTGSPSHSVTFQSDGTNWYALGR